MLTYWEIAPQDKAPIVAYLCFKSRLSVFQREQVKSYLPHVERLPYTAPMLERRAANGRSLPATPAHLRAAVFDVSAVAKDKVA